ncbi:autotransporter adhesin [Pasteurella multocida]|uniref:YadA-like family protein n=1 Tax=Pasteurella multocida TaxID=747 RepID=UPI000DA3B215|nr:YadA-like family protein [Pasteurella multocida]MDT8779016.1 YadA-like family protein [Pasteurella multocida]SQI51788.1 autotransporter adhesin [Pasteurella multocida]
MNKIYRTLWNVATQSWVVVSELAKAGGKTASGKSALVNSVSGFSFTLIAASVVLGSGQVSAAEVTGEEAGRDGNYCFYNAPSQSVVCGDATTKTTDKTDNKPAKSVVMGLGATNKGESNVAIGVSSKTENATAAIAVGASASAKANYAIAVGFEAEGNGQWDISIGRFAGKGASTSAGEGRNIAIGDGALKDSGPVNNNTVLGTGAGGNLVGDHNVIIGTYANFHNAAESAINSGTSLEKAKIKSKDVGGKTLYYVETPNVVAIGHRALATQSGAVAVGQQAKAFGVTTVAVGNGSRALNNNAVAMGREANAGASGAIAIGLRANYDSKNQNKAEGYKTTGANSVAIGVETHAQGTHSVAMGSYATIKALLPTDFTAGKITDKKGNVIDKASLGSTLTGNGSVAIGSESLVRGTNSVAIGQAAETLGQNAFAGGNDSHANGKSAVAIGDGATALKDSSTAIGSYTKALEGGAGAFGFSAQALTYRSLALGAESLATQGNHAIAIGNKAKTESEDAISMGYQANANKNAQNSIAIGKSALSGGKDSFSLGTNSGSFGIDSDNMGASDTSTITARTLAGKTNARGLVNLTSIGNQAGKDTINNNYGINIGYQAGSGGYNSIYGEGVSIGNKAGMLDKTNAAVKQAMEEFSSTKLKAQAGAIVTGNTNTAISSRAGVNALGHDNVAIGKDAGGYNSGNSNIAIGRHAGRSALAGNPNAIDSSIFNNISNTTAIGEWAYASAQNTTAIGTKAKASATGAMAFGHEAIAAHENAVALGAGAETAEAVATNQAEVKGFTYSGFAGKTPLATVSVGKASAERTITNVAAGRINATSTDAINGSQLYLALNALGNVGNTLVTNVLGGNAAINTTGDNAGTLTMSNIGGTGKGTIHDAIEAVNNTAKASKTTVKEGDNITVTEEAAADGSRTYTVATKKDVKFDSVVAGGTKIDANGLTFVDDQGTKIDNTPSISKTGIDAGNQKVTNVQNGTVEKDSKDAVNGGQLFAQGEGVKNIIGGNTTYNPTTGAYTNADIGGTGANTIHDAIAAVKAQAAQKTQVVEGKNITITNTGTPENPIYNVATKDAVEFDKTTVGSVVTDKNTNDITGLSNKTLGGANFAQNGRAASEEQLNATQNNLATLLGGNAQNTNGNVAMTDIGGTGKNNINDAIKASRNEVKQGKNMVVTPTVGANGQTIYEVATADKVAFDEVKVGGITMDGTTNKISGIAKGDISENSTDAVNGSQLYELQQKIAKSGDNYNILNNRINKVDKDLRAGIAGANAAAGLPQAYIPGKSMVAVAAGTYKGQNAIALGMSRISDNGKVIIKLTGNTNSRGDFGASIGAGYQW